MRVPTVENFLCCLRLEAGATFLGWLGSIGAVIGLVLFLFVFGVVIVDFQYFINATQNAADAHPDSPLNNPHSQLVMIVALLLGSVYCAISLYACVQLIKSVKSRSSRQVRPYLILIGFETVLAFLKILQFTLKDTCEAIIGTAINAYIFVCIHSLWEMFRDEAMRGQNRHYQLAMMEKV